MKKYFYICILIAVVLIGYWLKGQLKIDSCLDLGGKWNYENSSCEGAEEK